MVDWHLMRAEWLSKVRYLALCGWTSWCGTVWVLYIQQIEVHQGSGIFTKSISRVLTIAINSSSMR